MAVPYTSSSAVANSGQLANLHSTHDNVTNVNDSWPVHPIPFLRGPFAESIAEAMDPDLRIRRTLDAATRRLQLLELDDFSEAYSSRWRQKPGAKFHPLWKLIAQISFGVHLLQQRIAKSDEEVIKILQTHVDEVDGFLEDTNADFDLAIRDIDERTKLLLLPLDHGRTFGRMLRHRDFRQSILDGNDIIERIISRTTLAMNSSVEDVKKGIEATAELAKFLDRLGSEMRDQDRDLEGVYTAMRGNAEGWYCCFRGVQEKGERLAGLMARLEALVSEVNRRAGIASRRVLRESRLANGDGLKYENIRTPTTPSRRHTRALSLDKPLPPDPLRAPVMMTPERPPPRLESPHTSPEQSPAAQSPRSPARDQQNDIIILAPPQRPHDALPPLEALTEEAEADSEQDTSDGEDPDFGALLPSYPLDFKVDKADTEGTSTPQEGDAMLGRSTSHIPSPFALPRRTSIDGLMPLESMPVELDEHDIMQAQEERSLLQSQQAQPETESKALSSRTPPETPSVAAQHFASSACQDAFEERSLDTKPLTNDASRPQSPVELPSEEQKTFFGNSPPPLTKSGTTNSLSSVSAKSVDYAEIARYIELPASEPDAEHAEEPTQKSSVPNLDTKAILRASKSQPNLSPSPQPSRRRSLSDSPVKTTTNKFERPSLATTVLAMRSSSFAASQRDSKDSIISSYARDHRSKASPLSRSSPKFPSSGLARTVSIKAIGPTNDESQVQTTQAPPTRQPPPVPSAPVTPDPYLMVSREVTTPPRTATPTRFSRSPVNYRLMPDVRPIPSPEPEYSPRTALPVPNYPTPDLTHKKSQGFRKSGMNSIRGLLFKRSGQRQNSAGSLGGHVPMNY